MKLCSFWSREDQLSTWKYIFLPLSLIHSGIEPNQRTYFTDTLAVIFWKQVMQLPGSHFILFILLSFFHNSLLLKLLHMSLFFPHWTPPAHPYSPRPSLPHCLWPWAMHIGIQGAWLLISHLLTLPHLPSKFLHSVPGFHVSGSIPFISLFC